MSRVIDTKSPCVYFVDKRYCVGKECVYTGVRAINPLSAASIAWTLSFYNTRLGLNYDVSNLDLSAPINNEDVVIQIRDLILAQDVTHKVVVGLDLVCITRPPSIIDAGLENGKGFIYAGHGWDVTLAGADEGDTGYVEAVDYLRETQDGVSVKATIHHLCHNVSINVGDCNESVQFDQSKHSNIYSGKQINQYGEIEWVQGSQPIIMDNCRICDMCIKNCPRHAIHNKIDFTHKPLSEMDVNALGSEQYRLYEQYRINAKALSGLKAYNPEAGSGGIVNEGDVYQLVQNWVLGGGTISTGWAEIVEWDMGIWTQQ